MVLKAREKLERKGIDAIVVNDISDPGIGFDVEENEVTVVDADTERRIERAPKGAGAESICAYLDPQIRGRAPIPS